MFKSLLKIVALASLAPLITACDSEEQPGAQIAQENPAPKTQEEEVEVKVADPEAGKVEGSKYFNDYFGFSLDLNENWTINDPSSINNLTAGAIDEEVKDDGNANLLFISEFPATAELNKAVLFIHAESTDLFPEANNLAEFYQTYIYQKLQNATYLTANSQISDSLTVETINDTEFQTASLTLNLSGEAVNEEDRQVNYKFIFWQRLDSFITFTLIYYNDADLEKMMEMLETITISEVAEPQDTEAS
jgi:hypothetical protein